MVREHHYEAAVRWTGAEEGATSSYRGYSREYEAAVEGKSPLRLTADGAFLGDEALHNPEDLLVIALSGCHLLTYLAECARAGVHVLSYEDKASGTMAWDGETFKFSEVLLRPRVVIAQGCDPALAERLHHRSRDLCFVARSMNFPVRHESQVSVANGRKTHSPSVYSFGETDSAAQRLKSVSRIFDSASEAFISDATTATRPRLALDLGCGPGLTTRLLSRVSDARRVVGVDRSESFLDRARADSEGREEYVDGDVTGSLRCLDDVDESPDLIYARLLASHLPQPERAISGWFEELRSGGLLLVEEVESISTELDTFERYLEIVAGMLSHYGNELHVGPRLAATRWREGSSVEINRAVEVAPRVGDAAQMFSMNLANWRHDPYVEASYSHREIESLAAELEKLADRSDSGTIVWRIRQIALRHRPAGGERAPRDRPEPSV